MPEYATFISASETPMAGFMGRLQLLCGPDNVVLSRVTSRAGMPLLTDHRPDLALGMVQRLESRGSQHLGPAVVSDAVSVWDVADRNAPLLGRAPLAH